MAPIRTGTAIATSSRHPYVAQTAIQPIHPPGLQTVTQPLSLNGQVHSTIKTTMPTDGSATRNRYATHRSDGSRKTRVHGTKWNKATDDDKSLILSLFPQARMEIIHGCIEAGCSFTTRSLKAWVEHRSIHDAEWKSKACRWSGCKTNGKEVMQNAHFEEHLGMRSVCRECKCIVPGRRREFKQNHSSKLDGKHTQIFFWGPAMPTNETPASSPSHSHAATPSSVASAVWCYQHSQDSSLCPIFQTSECAWWSPTSASTSTSPSPYIQTPESYYSPTIEDASQPTLTYDPDFSLRYFFYNLPPASHFQVNFQTF